jgi:hypothetical protein
MKQIETKDLQLGDTVSLDYEAWDCAIVKQIKDGKVTLFRPYGTTAEFTYTGGVICYVGIEEWDIEANETPISLIRRRALK